MKIIRNADNSYYIQRQPWMKEGDDLLVSIKFKNHDKRPFRIATRFVGCELRFHGHDQARVIIPGISDRSAIRVLEILEETAGKETHLYKAKGLHDWDLHRDSPDEPAGKAEVKPYELFEIDGEPHVVTSKGNLKKIKLK